LVLLLLLFLSVDSHLSLLVIILSLARSLAHALSPTCSHAHSLSLSHPPPSSLSDDPEDDGTKRRYDASAFFKSKDKTKSATTASEYIVWDRQTRHRLISKRRRRRRRRRIIKA
jgi:hypothetical protein